ncbi:MAG: hypothetical protein JWR16_2175 [Nevskia sp.]|nr:hypothetical protein [Nevskia sp.]
MEDNKWGDIMNRNLLRPLLLTAAMVLLNGCGGGGGSGISVAVDTSPGGVFSADTTTVTPKLALITEAGAGWLYDESTHRGFAFTLDVAHAISQSDGTTQLSGTITAYDETSGAPVSTGTLQATVKGHAGPLTLSYALANSTSGSYTLSYESVLYEQPSGLSFVVGSYTPSASGATGGSAQLTSVTISGTGGFAASDTAGCSYAGTIAAVSSVYNAYQLSGISQTGTGCSATGLGGQAVVIPATATVAQQLTLSIANASQQLAATLTRH